MKRSSPDIVRRPSWSGRRICILIASVLLSLWECLESLAPAAAPPPRDSDAPVAAVPGGSFVPEGTAVALPSILISDEEDSKIERRIYGGRGDKAHLGGFTSFDEMGVGIALWKHMVTYLGIKSVLDLGCGRGTSTSWFVTHGLEYVVCAEGRHDAVSQSLLPKIPPSRIPNGTVYEIVEHDFSRGPWWPSRTVVRFSMHIPCRRRPPLYYMACNSFGTFYPRENRSFARGCGLVR